MKYYVFSDPVLFPQPCFLFFRNATQKQLRKIFDGLPTLNVFLHYTDAETFLVAKKVFNAQDQTPDDKKQRLIYQVESEGDLKLNLLSKDEPYSAPNNSLLDILLEKIPHGYQLPPYCEMPNTANLKLIQAWDESGNNFLLTQENNASLISYL